MIPLLLGCAGPDQAHPRDHDDPSTSGPLLPLLRFEGPPPTNLIFVTLDTTRRDRVGRYSGSGATPNLDRILSESVVLDDHRSCSNWTGPSMTCLTTGNTPFEEGWWPWSTDPRIPDRIDDLDTLASDLADENWITSVVTGNQVFGRDLNLVRGFQHVVNPEFQPADVVADRALDEARSLVAQFLPFYLHVHFIDPHQTYCPPDGYGDRSDWVDLGVDLCPDAAELFTDEYPSESPQWQSAFRVDVDELYTGELAYWDHEFGRFWDELDEMGALDDALVVFATDHGEQLAERGELGHGHALGSEENRAVAAFWAESLPPVAWDRPTVHQDVAATLRDVFDLTSAQPSSGMVVGTAPRDRPIRGMNFWSAPGPYWYTAGPQLSIVQDGVQLTYDWWGERHLYRLSEDPAGLADIYDPDDAATVSAWGPMGEFVDEVAGAWDHLDAPVAPGP